MIQLWSNGDEVEMGMQAGFAFRSVMELTASLLSGEEPVSFRLGKHGVLWFVCTDLASGRSCNLGWDTEKGLYKALDREDPWDVEKGSGWCDGGRMYEWLKREGFSEAFWDSEWLGVDESEEEALVRLSERGERGVLQLPLWIPKPEGTRWDVLRVGSVCRFDG